MLWISESFTHAEFDYGADRWRGTLQRGHQGHDHVLMHRITFEPEIRKPQTREWRRGRRAVHWLFVSSLALLALVTVGGGLLWLLAGEAMGGEVRNTHVA